MDGEHGIDNIMEVLAALPVTVKTAIKQGSDGATGDDIAAFFNLYFNPKVQLAVDNIKKIKEEGSDLDLDEIEKLTEKSRQVTFQIIRIILGKDEDIPVAA